MTEEELRKEATSTVEWECTPMIDRPLFVHAYITGAEPREKRIDELEKQNKELHQKITYLENDKEDILANWYCDKVGKCKVAELEKVCQDLSDKFDYQVKQVMKLEKENTELKERAGESKWHELDWHEDFPDVDKLVRVRTKYGEEYICETYSYCPAEDEIGYGSVITQFEELNGDWVDDNEIKYWCYIEPFKEIKENE